MSALDGLLDDAGGPEFVNSDLGGFDFDLGSHGPNLTNQSDIGQYYMRLVNQLLAEAGYGSLEEAYADGVKGLNFLNGEPALTYQEGYGPDTSVPDEGLGISGEVGPDGQMPDLGPEEEPGFLEGLLDGISGIMDWVGQYGTGTIGIPIPGLPFPIPGDMTLQDLIDIAAATGRTVLDVLGDLNSDPEQEPEVTVTPGDTDTSQPPVTNDDDDQGTLITGAPSWWEGGSLGDGVNEGDPLPGVVSPGVDDFEEEEPATGIVTATQGGNGPPGANNPFNPGFGGEAAQPEIPGFVPYDNEDTPPVAPEDPFGENPPDENPEDGPDETPGLNPAWAGPLLIGLLGMNGDEPEQQVFTPNMTYHQPDRSWGINRPDYGQPINRPLFDMPPRVAQPMQVGYDPQPRRDYINPVEAERLRRQRMGLLG